jgi:ABC-type multidrug transport system ATPase subunit
VTLLQFSGVTRVYGSGRRARTGLRDVTLAVSPGEIVGLVGPNGAGKTTLLRLAAGELVPTSGEVLVEEHRAGTRAARLLVGFAPDPPVAPPELTGLEWLWYIASHRARTGAERANLVAQAIGLGELEEFAARRIAGYSRGMALRLGLAAAALGRAPLLLLDETLSGLDPLVQRRLREQIGRLTLGGRAVIVASHDLGALERIATRVLVMLEGRVIADVAIADLLAERVAELSFTGAGLPGLDRVLLRFPAALRTGSGVSVPLVRGLTIEHVFAVCREERVAVAGSRVRYRALEDLLVAAAQGRRNGGA